MAQPRRSGFLGRSLDRCSLRSWQPSRFPLLPSGHYDALWARLKGCRVADAVIEAGSFLLGKALYEESFGMLVEFLVVGSKGKGPP